MTMRVQPLPNQSPKAGMTIVSTTITRTHTVYQRQQTTNSNLNRTQTVNSRVGQQTQEPQQSSHEQRVKELKNAVRTLSFLSGCVFVLGALCIVVDLPDSLASLLGSYADDTLLYGPRRDEYSIMAKAFPIIQNINLAVVVWYTWTPWLFLPKYRVASGVTFMEGLKNGMEVALGSRYEPQSKKGAAPDSKLLRANTIKSIQRTASIGGGANTATKGTGGGGGGVGSEDKPRHGHGFSSSLAGSNGTGTATPSGPTGVSSPGSSAPPTSKKAWGSMGGAGAGGMATQLATAAIVTPMPVNEEETSVSE
jgi:hypothetical protein